MVSSMEEGGGVMVNKSTKYICMGYNVSKCREKLVKATY